MTARFPFAIAFALTLGACGSDSSSGSTAGSGNASGGHGTGGTGATSSGGSGTGAAPSGGVANASGGTPSTGGNPASGGASTGGSTATGGSAGSSSTCGIALGNTTCTGTGHCQWTAADGCSFGSCDCKSGKWACVETRVGNCGGTCPTPQNAECGQPCTGQASGCICACGGPNFTGCSCTGGVWACPGC
jgi:hypothetical protein